MGLFQQKKRKTPQDQVVEEVKSLFDNEFREQLREHGRLYFERVINENAALFKQDLDATVAHINTELRQHIARQLDNQFTQINQVNTELRKHITDQLDKQFIEYSHTMKEAQEMALRTLEKSADALKEQHQALSAALERSVAKQDAMLTSAVEENKNHIEEMKAAHQAAVQSLTQSVEALKEQQTQLSALLDKSIAQQQDLIIETFMNNMARVVEHYVLGALGDQYDVKAQLPSIIQQLEENKKEIADDMKL